MKILKALSDETRLRIIKLLEDGEHCVCDIVAALDMVQPKVSFHLGVLKEAGLIKDRKDGKWSYYSLNDADILRRFLLFTVIEKVGEEDTKDDSKRLKSFLEYKGQKQSG
ncbi:MAG: ArsR/SmtB family transcription factor [Dissulfurimicrobium sp.]|uniref:ArsR/SmtB family transcription factor n=1 Tax=Dissulfurimicrobium hydrothermale TaxID=1750598 RepID=UPI001ED9CEA2|nr:metalloregulator ArsR/SmtB family transcription factor [Dissulfurimicrobium hydrothermale]UKL12972.1 metalloregulator ArsR/SmtB family transcription factor [Dissulfurimicrobium hydrothermale]